MDTKKQKLIIEYLLSSADTFARCAGIIKSNYFDPEYRIAVSFIQKYYDKYNTTPNTDQVEAETSISFKLHEIENDKLDYTAIEVEKFCKRRAIEQAVLAAPPLIADGDYDAVAEIYKEALLISLQRDCGLRYFDDPETRLRRLLEEDITCPTGWKEVDELLYGGISRKELILFSANSGGGKSITLANLGLNFIKQGLNVLYITLELSRDVVSQRFDTMITGISRNDFKSHISEIVTRLQSEKQKDGILDIAHMRSGTKPNEIRAYLKEYFLLYNMMPDLLILDYLDKMSPNEKVSADNVFEKDKRCSEQLRDIGVDHNMFIATASQLNRSAITATHHDQSQIAGGISKINESDVYISIVMSDTMKAAGEMMFCLQKTRNSDGNGKNVYLTWDNKFLRVRDKTDNKDNSFEQSLQKISSNKSASNISLLDIMQDLD